MINAIAVMLIVVLLAYLGHYNYKLSISSESKIQRLLKDCIDKEIEIAELRKEVLRLRKKLDD